MEQEARFVRWRVEGMVNGVGMGRRWCWVSGRVDWTIVAG